MLHYKYRRFNQTTRLEIPLGQIHVHVRLFGFLKLKLIHSPNLYTITFHYN